MQNCLLYFDYFKIKLYIKNYIKIIFILFEYFNILFEYFNISLFELIDLNFML